MNKKAIRAMQKANTTHGMSKTRFWSIYFGIKNRCERKNFPKYKVYGARGIKCLWRSFEEFRDDMYESYKEHAEEHGEKNTTIERIDNDGSYCKENCRWATLQEQALNKQNTILVEGKTITELAQEKDVSYGAIYGRVKSNKKLSNFRRRKEITFKGETLGTVEWSKKTGIPSKVIYARIFYKKWSVERALTTPYTTDLTKRASKGKRMITHNGKTQSLSDWARESGIKMGTLWFRLKKGVPFEKALTNLMK